MLAQTNAGGENVARGALLGALMGAAHGTAAFPQHFLDGPRGMWRGTPRASRTAPSTWMRRVWPHAPSAWIPAWRMHVCV